MNSNNLNTLRVDIISDVVCPWCIVGYLQLVEAAKASAVELDVHWHPFELNPEMPDVGQNLREHIMEKYGISREESDKNRERLVETGAKLGFNFVFDDDSHMPNTFRAHQLIHWADEQGKGHALKMALFTAHFTDGRDVNDKSVLIEEAGKLGLDRESAAQALADERFAEDVREAEARVHAQGISSVPTMIFAEKFGVSGAQGVEAYMRVMLHVQKELQPSIN